MKIDEQIWADAGYCWLKVTTTTDYRYLTLTQDTGGRVILQRSSPPPGDPELLHQEPGC